MFVGLTGGIGSGKSTVAAVLSSLGAAVIDADAISRELTAIGGLALDAISATFGADYITPAGALDRDRMRSLAFADPGAKRKLEAIIHPLVGQLTWQRAESAQSAGYQCLVFDVPLLVESGTWRSKVDKVLVVDCCVETQITRVMSRSDLKRGAVEAIILAQASRQRRLQSADAVIFNDALSLQELDLQIQALAPNFGLSLRQNSELIHT